MRSNLIVKLYRNSRGNATVFTLQFVNPPLQIEEKELFRAAGEVFYRAFRSDRARR